MSFLPRINWPFPSASFLVFPICQCNTYGKMVSFGRKRLILSRERGNQEWLPLESPKRAFNARGLRAF